MRESFFKYSLLCICAAALVVGPTTTLAQTNQTAMTYNGRLADGTNASNGWFDFRVGLYTNANGGAALGDGIQSFLRVPVINGSFTITPDFGANVFSGSPFWLELAVRTNGSPTFAVMQPRYAIRPVPVAQFAMSPAGPQGAVGPSGSNGLNGANATISITNVVTGTPGSAAAVLNLGSPSSAVLRFTIPQGATGASGPQGLTGPQGATGAIGLTGAAGPTGPQGLKGDAGSPGAQGTPGTNGTNGLSATITIGRVIAGGAGSPAEVTNRGTAGAAVLDFVIPQGITGASGPAGPAGAQGPKGDTGATGNAGPQGIVGPQGSPGANGTNGLSATIAVGKVLTAEPGAIAVVTNRGTAAAAVLDFVVPQGSPGNTGLAGPAGPQGLKGDTGPAGPQGIQGLKGETGAQGPVGMQGTPGSNSTITIADVLTGTAGGAASVTNLGNATAAVLRFTIPSGVQGPAGAAGSRGPQGEQGPKGDPGSTGLQGTPGLAGINGLNSTVVITNTITGEPGSVAAVTNLGTPSLAILKFTIPQGMSGTNGLNGSPGPQGSPGAKGDTGTTGPIGPQGPPGAQGIQGPPGSPGTAALGNTALSSSPADADLVAAGFKLQQGQTIKSGGVWTRVKAATNAPSIIQDVYWTGTKFIAVNCWHQFVWGAPDQWHWVGGNFDPASNTWEDVDFSGAPPATGNFTTVAWTGSELLVANGTQGAGYNPTNHTWRSLNMSGFPAGNWKSVWDERSKSLFVFRLGGSTIDAASYEPSSDQWTTLPSTDIGLAASQLICQIAERKVVILTGSEIGPSGYHYSVSGVIATYDTLTKTWTNSNKVVGSKTYLSGVQTFTLGSKVLFNGSDASTLGGSQGYIEHPWQWTFDPILNTAT